MCDTSMRLRGSTKDGISFPAKLAKRKRMNEAVYERQIKVCFGAEPAEPVDLVISDCPTKHFLHPSSAMIEHPCRDCTVETRTHR